MADSIRKFSDIQNIEEISDPRDLLNLIRKALTAYTHNAQKPLIKLLYKKGVSQKEIAAAKNVTTGSFSLHFPKKELKNG